MTETQRYGTIDTEYAAQLGTTTEADDGPIWMINLMKYRDVADYADGRQSTISGREADDNYAPVDILNDIGAEIVFVADVDQQLLGDDTRWDRVAIVKYPTRRAFIEMQGRPDFQDKHVHKDAGMESTIVAGCLPIPHPQGETVDWAEVPHPPTADDAAVVVIHVLRFDEASAAEVTPRKWLRTRTRPHGWQCRTVFESTDGSASKAPSSEMAGPGTRSGSTSSRARPPSWRW